MIPVERVKAIILKPKLEWPVIEAESTTIGEIYSKYVVILAAIPAVAGFLGSSILGFGLFGSTFRVPIVTGITAMVVQYATALGGVYVLALIIEALAPTFGGVKDRVMAFKVAAYSSTAAWLAGIFMLLPGLRILGILGIYSLYLLFLGLPILMKAPEEKATGYVAAAIIAGIVVFIVIQSIVALITPGVGLY